MYIDNNPVFVKFLFRNRPLTNPALTSADLIKIRSLAQTEENTAGNPNPWLSADNPHIKIHPVLSRIGWYVDQHIDPDNDDEVYIVNSGLKMKDVPHILDECATCPPTSEIVVDLDMSYYNSYYEPRIDPSITSYDNQHEQQPILVRDVIDELLSASVQLYHERKLRSRDSLTSTDFKTHVDNDYPPLMIWRNGWLLRFRFRSEIEYCL